MARQEIAAPRASGFHRKLEGTQRTMGFAEIVWEVCEPAYADEFKVGRPGIDPTVYFKMQMVGFFEDLPSQRAIAARCDDSRAIREFLGHELTEATPEQSSFTVIRQRLSLENRPLSARGSARGQSSLREDAGEVDSDF